MLDIDARSALIYPFRVLSVERSLVNSDFRQPGFDDKTVIDTFHIPEFDDSNLNTGSRVWSLESRPDR